MGQQTVETVTATSMTRGTYTFCKEENRGHLQSSNKIGTKSVAKRLQKRYKTRRRRRRATVGVAVIEQNISDWRGREGSFLK